MEYRKMMIPILMVVLAVVLYYIWQKNQTKEDFGMNPSMSWKVDRQVINPSKAGMAKGDFYSTPGYHSKLPPRMGNVQYGANIKARPPSYDHLGVPSNPIGIGGDVEGYRRPVQNDIIEPYHDLTGGQVYSAGDAMLPQADSTSTMNALGETVEPVIVERLIYANKNSKLRGAGDPIRGDIYIEPMKGNWFVPSVNPHVDLQQGAMNVMGGVTNETSRALDDQLYFESGDTTLGGVDYGEYLQGGSQDLIVNY